MDNEIFKLFGSIGADTSAADKAIDDTVDNAEKEVKKIPDFFKTAAKAIGTVFAIKQIIDFGQASVEAAAAADAMRSQFAQVFGDIETDAQGYLNAIADDTGMLPNRLKGAFTQIAAFAKTTGMETADALALTERATRAAADGAAFYDKSVEEVTASLQSFLKGNFENDAALGISATETTRNAKANELYGKSFIQLSEDQKQLTLLAMVEDGNKLSGALGQAAREADTYGNQVGNLKQAWNDFKVLIGTPMMGVVIDGLKQLSEWVQAAGEKVKQFTDWAKENETAVILMGIALGVITALIIVYNIQQALATAQTTIWGIVAGTATGITTALGAAFAFLVSPIGLAILAIGAIIAIGVLLWKNWDTIKEKAGQLWGYLKEKFAQIGEAIMRPIEKAKNFVKDMIDKIKSFFKFKWSLPELKMPKIAIDGKFSLLPPSVPKFSIKWNKDGFLMDQANIFGSLGNTLLGGGEAGPEALLPLNRDVLGNIGAGIADASNFNQPGILDRLDAIIDLLLDLINIDPKYQVLLDSGALVGELTPLIDQRMGRRAERKMRGG